MSDLNAQTPAQPPQQQQQSGQSQPAQAPGGSAESANPRIERAPAPRPITDWASI